jgi:MoaD family protein
MLATTRAIRQLKSWQIMLILGDRTLRVSVRYFTVLREIVGKKEETIEFLKGQKATVSSVLKCLSTKYGKEFDEYVYDPKTREVKGFLQFLVNGRSLSGAKSIESPLSDGDVLAILPPVSGG